MTMHTAMLLPRHIQNMSEAKILQPHWGYADRALPCTNDPGSCEYLDSVYHSHDLGMLYCGIIWASIGAILLIWAIGRQIFHEGRESHPSSKKTSIGRAKDAVATLCRRRLLPESLRPIFGRTSRLQLLILFTLVGYLTVFTFVGIEYRKWVTPVKNSPGVFNTRTGLGPWSDRIGVLAYALTPLSVMLSSRESLLSIITGVPYQHFNFLHRWLGYVIFVQSALHTIGWCVVEIRLYQPQPEVALGWISQKYMIWGVIAMFFLTVLFGLSTPWAIRRTGYEFFRKCHYVMAMLYIGACWGHWSKLECYLIPSLVIWFIDRGARLVRTALLHYNYLPNGDMGFQTAKAAFTRFPNSIDGDVVRLDFVHPSDPWMIGQHFYLCFPKLSTWQSHPFTPCSLPGTKAQGSVHSYILRAKMGATRALSELSAAELTAVDDDKNNSGQLRETTSVIITGPYGCSITDNLAQTANILCIAGGTGITFVLPVLLDLVKQPVAKNRQVELVWAIRRDSDISWVEQELDQVRRAASVNVHIFVTRTSQQLPSKERIKQAEVSETQMHDKERDDSSESSSTPDSREDTQRSHPQTLFSMQHAESSNAEPQLRRPNLGRIVERFVESTVCGPTSVFSSGPGEMISDLRSIVASCNSGERVWKGQERFDVRLICDDRLEW